MKKVSIIVPLYIPYHLKHKINKFLIPQLESLVNYTDKNLCEVIYVINGSIGEVLQIVNSYKDKLDLKIFWSDEGMGFTKAVNYGMKQSIGEFILLLNDDAFFLPQEKNYVINRLLDPFKDFEVGITGITASHIDGWVFIIGYCMMLRREMLNKIGLMDEIFNPGGDEDADVCFRANQFKWKIITVLDQGTLEQSQEDKRLIVGPLPFYHAGEESVHHIRFQNDDEFKNKIFNKNDLLIRQRIKNNYYSRENLEKNLYNIPRL